MALVVGSMIPDAWYITVGWLYGPMGIALWVDGHQLSNSLNTILVPATVIALAVRRWVLVDAWRPRWWITAVSAYGGGLTHLVLDELTHWHVGGIPIGQVASSLLLMLVVLELMRRWWPQWRARVTPLGRHGRGVLMAATVGGVAWALARNGDGVMARFFTAVNAAAIGWIVAAAVDPIARRARRIAAGERIATGERIAAGE